MKRDITVFYAPQPDDQSDEASAAFEYAKRVSDLLSKKDEVVIHRLSADSLERPSCGSTTAGESNKASTPSPTTCFTFVLLSCSADGSVDRAVRKITRNLMNQSPTSSVAAVALLGHARCENSANQMKDTIFHHGRKFHKCLNNKDKHSVKLLEVQVELEGPDQPGGFDEWVEANAPPPTQESK